MKHIKSTVIAAGMLTLTALATLPAGASEEDFLEWTAVTIQCGRTPEAGEISCEARAGEMGWAACTVRAFGKEYVLPEAALAKLKGFPLSSLETTHEVGYEELGGYTVHFRFARTVRNPENKEVTEIIYVSVNKNGLSVSEPRPENNSLQGAGAESPRVVSAIADELRVTLKGGGISGTFPVTPNETSCGRLNWDGVPDKDGAMSGGQCEITVQLVDKSVVLKEHTLASDKGIRSDIIAKTIVPTDKVPWTGKISQTTVTVFRVEPDKENSPASPVPPQASPAAEQQDIAALPNYVGKTYQEMLKELGPPADKTSYTIEHAPTKGWNHGEMFSLYPKNEKNKDIQIMEVTWTAGEFNIHACYHMIKEQNVCFVAKRIKKSIRF